MRRWGLAALVAAALCGCPQDITGLEEDAGTDAAVDAGGHDGADSGTDAGSTDAGKTDAGTPEDAGTDAGSGPAALTWGKMTSAVNNAVDDVAGTALDNVYAVGDPGAIQHFNGSQWTKVTQSPGNNTLYSVWVAPNGAVFAGGMSQLVSCKSNCTSAANYKWSTAKEIHGVCGLDENTVYATGYGGINPNTGVLYKFNPSNDAWDLIESDTGSYTNTDCWVAPSGAVFITAQSKVLRYQNGTLFDETINFPAGWTINDIAYQQFQAVWGSGTAVFAAGYRRGVIQRNAQGTWDYVQQADGVNHYHAIAGSSPTDVVVAGAKSSTDRDMRVFDGTAWTTPPNIPPIDVWGMTALDARTYFAVGTASGIDAAIYIGTRP